MTNDEFIKSVSLEGEEWRIIEGTFDCFAVSTFGRIASLSRLVKNGTCMYYTKQHILTPMRNKGGYLLIRLGLQGKLKINSVVHRLVAKAFIPNPNGYKYIDHIDGNPSNNNVSNLRWCTHSMNMMNPITRIRNSNAKKGKMPINAKKVVQLKNGLLINLFQSIREAARKNHISTSSISECINQKRESYKECKWMYLSDYETLINNSKNSNLSD